MMYEEVVADFADRTLANLRSIRQAKDQGQEVFEVTQLINSMLGLLVFPQQTYCDGIPATPLDQLVSQGWPRIRATNFPGFEPCQDLRSLVRYLRNAIAHFNLKFIASNGKIEGVKVWNNTRGRMNWEADLTLDELLRLTERFVEMLRQPVMEEEDDV